MSRWFSNWTFLHSGNRGHPVLVICGHLVVVQGLQRPAVALGIVHAEGGEKLEHLLLHLATVRVQS